jgi:sorbitol-specific phosphotransferase system component IIA
MWGTIVWLIEYKRGEQRDYVVIHRSGTDEESVRKGLVLSLNRCGWGIVKIDVICNTFKNPKEN